jgi:hypothetical protein
VVEVDVEFAKQKLDKMVVLVEALEANQLLIVVVELVLLIKVEMVVLMELALLIVLVLVVALMLLVQ